MHVLGPHILKEEEKKSHSWSPIPLLPLGPSPLSCPVMLLAGWFPVTQHCCALRSLLQPFQPALHPLRLLPATEELQAEPKGHI